MLRVVGGYIGTLYGSIARRFGFVRLIVRVH